MRRGNDSRAMVWMIGTRFIILYNGNYINRVFYKNIKYCIKVTKRSLPSFACNGRWVHILGQFFFLNFFYYNKRHTSTSAT